MPLLCCDLQTGSGARVSVSIYCSERTLVVWLNLLGLLVVVVGLIIIIIMIMMIMLAAPPPPLGLCSVAARAAIDDDHRHLERANGGAQPSHGAAG